MDDIEDLRGEVLVYDESRGINEKGHEGSDPQEGNFQAQTEHGWSGGDKPPQQRNGRLWLSEDV